MHRYFIKTPWIIRSIFRSYVWRLPVKDPVVYLTFDDGPHPEITPWVLDQLKQFNAKASFFCIGKNVDAYPAIFSRIQTEGHAIGNHTQRHLNGWKSNAEQYLRDVNEASKLIRSSLFRPPYGRIKNSQARGVKKILGASGTIIMWDVLSADFDQSISGEECLDNILKNYEPGSIIVFHDSEKAFRNLSFALPRLLQHLQNQGFNCMPLINCAGPNN